jgi:hypothetical protein
LDFPQQIQHQPRHLRVLRHGLLTTAPSVRLQWWLDPNLNASRVQSVIDESQQTPGLRPSLPFWRSPMHIGDHRLDNLMESSDIN